MSKWFNKDVYSWFTPRSFDEYEYHMIGSYRSELEGMTIPDRRETSYLEALKYNANLIWDECNTPNLSLTNMDVMNTALLSLHPNSLLKDKEISDNTREALLAMAKFRDLILLKDYSKEKVQSWLEVATSMNYSAQIVLMAWFLTLFSKITGLKIPGVQKLMAGGRAQLTKEEAMMHLSTMGAIAQAMYINNYWDRPQYSILREMYNDLQKMINKY